MEKITNGGIPVYTKDKNHRITLRLNEEQFNFVRLNAEALDVSPSDFLRMVVNLAMSSTKQLEIKLKEGVGRENDKADFDGIV